MALRLTSLENLFLEQLQELYNAQHQLISALPRLAEEAGAEDIKARFYEYQRQAKEQVAHLEIIFAERGEKLRGRKSLGMAGILQEGFDLIEKQHSPEMKDAGLFDIIRKAEHYEIACYGTTRSYAVLLGHHEEARSLRRALRNKHQYQQYWKGKSSPPNYAGV